MEAREQKPAPTSEEIEPSPVPDTLPAPGYPFAEPELRDWFRRTRGREASDLEIGALMAAMATRDASPATDAQGDPSRGWHIGTMIPPKPGG